MQAEILAANAGSAIRILGVNATGQEYANALAVEGNTIPWLQDVENEVWTSWAVTWRDVVILDADNRKVAVFNLTEHDITRPSEYDALLALLRATAHE